MEKICNYSVRRSALEGKLFPTQDRINKTNNKQKNEKNQTKNNVLTERRMLLITTLY